MKISAQFPTTHKIRSISKTNFKSMGETVIHSQKMIQCEICSQKLEEIQNFEIRVYHLWKEHQQVATDQEIDSFFHNCEV